MLLRYSFDMGEDANMVENAVANVLAAGFRTGDIAGPNDKVVSTTQMGDALLLELDKQSA